MNVVENEVTPLPRIPLVPRLIRREPKLPLMRTLWPLPLTLRRIALTCTDAVQLAHASRGITRVLSYMISPPFKAGLLEIVLEDFEPHAVPVYVLHKEPSRTSARVRAVVDYLVERLRTDPVLLP